MSEQDPKPPIQIYDTDAVQLDTYIQVSRVEIVPNQGGGDLVEVRTEENDDRLWKSLRWRCRQDDAPQAGQVFHLLLIKPNYAVMEEGVEPQPPADPPGAKEESANLVGTPDDVINPED